MKKSMVSNIFNFPVHKEGKDDKKVSYSQYTMWANCPKQWKLTYMDGHKDFDPSIHLLYTLLITIKNNTPIKNSIKYFRIFSIIIIN